ncbi:uncharacterized protein LOC132699877 [Cylas formicarius]|uniref:uncharacterized protein LOC132699877 n=1 Tax=Cylas formicarius TaxID=197179 RepID=UPI0029588D36|nr:uncharacterized protein LOC132699877 [Cylas formicarius]XP_060522814.1 uncharacterized protein LOC132699877 [Cylas formicarius]
MSPDMDKKAEEEEDKEEQNIKQRKTLKDWGKELWQLIFKILELILCAFCLACFFEPAKMSIRDRPLQFQLDQSGLMFTTFAGYILINLVLLVSWLLGDKMPYKMSAAFSVCASALFLVSGIFLIVGRRKFDEPHMYLTTMMTSATAFAFVNAALFAADGIFSFVTRQDFENIYLKG